MRNAPMLISSWSKRLNSNEILRYTEGESLFGLPSRIPNDTGRDQILTSLLKRNKFSTEILLLLRQTCWEIVLRKLVSMALEKKKKKKEKYVKGDFRSRVIGWKDMR